MNDGDLKYKSAANVLKGIMISNLFTVIFNGVGFFLISFVTQVTEYGVYLYPFFNISCALGTMGTLYFHLKGVRIRQNYKKQKLASTTIVSIKSPPNTSSIVEQEVKSL